MLEITNATKVFSKRTVNEHMALKGIDLHLKPGDFVTMIGSNGAGKSTLMNAIGGCFLLDRGRMQLDDKDITFMPEHKRSRMIGRLFQDPMKGTAPDMTIEENLSLAYSRGKHKSLGFAVKKKDREFFRFSLKEFGMGLEDRLQTKVGLLSGGQRQAITLLMCTIASPKLLLLDEHTAALDPVAAQTVLEITRKIVEKNSLTTLMITHNMKSALEIGNRCIMMSTGKIILDISGKEKQQMTVEKLLDLYSLNTNGNLDNDRMLLVK